MFTYKIVYTNARVSYKYIRSTGYGPTLSRILFISRSRALRKLQSWVVNNVKNKKKERNSSYEYTVL